MKKFFNNMKKYNKYAIRSAKAELKSEVVDSYLNWLWWVIEPFAFMIIYTFVFGYIFKTKTPYFASFVLIGQTLWDFFNRMVSGSVKLISNNRDLVTKVYIPKYILLYSKSLTYLFKMTISMVLVFFLMIYQKVPFTFNILYVIPIVIVLYLVSFGLGLILMHYGVTFNDLSNLTNIVLKMVLYLSGIFYNIEERLTGRVGWVLLRLNPIAFCMNQARKACLYNTIPSFKFLLAWFVAGLLLSIYGINKIHKYENSYAKVI